MFTSRFQKSNNSHNPSVLEAVCFATTFLSMLLFPLLLQTHKFDGGMFQGFMAGFLIGSASRNAVSFLKLAFQTSWNEKPLRVFKRKQAYRILSMLVVVAITSSAVVVWGTKLGFLDNTPSFLIGGLVALALHALGNGSILERKI